MTIRPRWGNSTTRSILPRMRRPLSSFRWKSCSTLRVMAPERGGDSRKRRRFALSSRRTFSLRQPEGTEWSRQDSAKRREKKGWQRRFALGIGFRVGEQQLFRGGRSRGFKEERFFPLPLLGSSQNNPVGTQQFAITVGEDGVLGVILRKNPLQHATEEYH